MLLLLALCACFGLGCTKNFLEIPLQIEQVKQPVSPVTVGSRFEFTGVYKTGPSSQQNVLAQVILYDDVGNEPLLLQLRMSYGGEPLGSHLDYFLVSSKYGNKYASAQDLGYEKRFEFPMDLEDGLEIEILLEVTEDYYEVTINGVKSTESMINSRENVEYFKTKTLKVKSSSSFSFTTSLQMIKIGEATFNCM